MALTPTGGVTLRPDRTIHRNWTVPSRLGGARQAISLRVACSANGYRDGMPNAAKTLMLTFRAEADAVARARHALREFAADAGASADQIDAVRLASSEAVTNAVLHAYRDEPGKVYVSAALVSDELWILIADDGCGLEPRTGRPGLGLGLGLISQVSDQLTIVARSGGGTEVRMRFDLGDPDPSGYRSGPATRSRRFGSRTRTLRRRGSPA